MAGRTTMLMANLTWSVLGPVALALGPSDVGDTIDHSDFDAILRATVRDERVDYLTIRSKHYAALVDYLDRLRVADISKLSRSEQLATFLNLYNATMIRAIVERFHDGYSPSEADFAVFQEPLVRFGEETFSLNALENDKIRPVFQEPRIHVALVCGARSCPPLIARAYTGAQLKEVLEDNMFRFVRDTFRNPIDVAKGELVLSKIFDWYAQDFGGAEGVVSYVDRYHGGELAKLKPSFAEYDWSLNLAAPSTGDYVVVGAETSLEAEPGGKAVTVHAGEVFEVLEKHDGRVELDLGRGRGRGVLLESATKPWRAPVR